MAKWNDEERELGDGNVYQFFTEATLRTGAHLIACGTFGVTCAWVNGRGGARHLLCWTSLIVNAALAVRIAILIINGTVRGPLIVAAPLLLGLPAVLNVASAVLILRRRAPGCHYQAAGGSLRKK